MLTLNSAEKVQVSNVRNKPAVPEICKKPLQRKAYGSIPHLSTSRLGPGDYSVSSGVDRICTEQSREGDLVIVQEKLDGSCCAVAKKNGRIISLVRAGYHAITSPYPQHALFARWVSLHADAFDALLNEGERVVGEWLAVAHGTIYSPVRFPFVAFDIMTESTRICCNAFLERVGQIECLAVPTIVHVGQAISVEDAWGTLLSSERCPPCDLPEGLIYRIERHSQVEQIAKWVHPNKVDGKYLAKQIGQPDVQLWHPDGAISHHELPDQ